MVKIFRTRVQGAVDDDLTNEAKTCISNPDGVFGIHRLFFWLQAATRLKASSTAASASSDPSSEYPYKINPVARTMRTADA